MATVAGSFACMTEEEKSVSTTNSAPAAWLTQEAFDRLTAELDHLSGAGRAEIVQKIEAARQEGDLKENGATTRPRKSRARSRPASASSLPCCVMPTSGKLPPTTESSKPA